MRLYKILILLFFTFISVGHAQQIFFCKSYTTDGEPIDASLRWEIRPSGGEVYILYQNGGKPIMDPLCYVFIDKFTEGAFRPFDSKVIKVDKDDTWTVIDYEFKEEGRYEIYFMNSSQKRLATSRINVSFGSEINPSRRYYKSRYYDNCKFLFATAIIGGKPYNVKNSTSLSQDDGEIFIYLVNDDSLNTSTLVAEVWRKSDFSSNYDEFVETKKYKIEPGWFDTFFKYKFSRPGQYQISLYNDNEVLIGSNYLKVNN